MLLSSFEETNMICTGRAVEGREGDLAAAWSEEGREWKIAKGMAGDDEGIARGGATAATTSVFEEKRRCRRRSYYDDDNF